ncbi:hypothetical protein JN540_07755, partial [Streptococcus suis]|nr:hypothetical protein [Streptococcus suis]
MSLITYLERSFLQISQLLLKKFPAHQMMNRTPKVRMKKSNLWGAIFMKLSYEDKVQIYELRQNGNSL